MLKNVTISCSKCAILENEISELRSLVKGLEDEISLLKGSRSSRTSSTAPSHDIGRSNRVSLVTPSGKKPGGQPGHVGATLSLSDTPDEIVDHHPHSCEHCGTDLQAIESCIFYPSSNCGYS